MKRYTWSAVFQYGRHYSCVENDSRCRYYFYFILSNIWINEAWPLLL